MIDQHYIKKIKDLFVLRDDAYAIQNPNGTYTKIDKELTKRVIQKHLDQEITIGIYQLNKENKVKWICYDFDGEKPSDVWSEALRFFLKLKDEDKLNPLMEFSGMKGFHVWLFCELSDAYDVKRYAEELADDFVIHEIFPKQTEISEGGYGNLVKLPLGKHQVSGFCSYFFDPSNVEESHIDLESSFKILEGLK